MVEIVTLKGSPYEIGQQTGRVMREAGVEFYKPREKSISFALRVKEAVQDLIPEIIEEINGFVEAGNFELETILSYALTVYRSAGCTVLAINGEHTSEGRHLFCRNYDSSPNETFSLYKTYPKAKLSHIGFSSLLIGREDGINEAGLAIAVTGVPGKYTNKLGLWDHIPVRVVLERCKTVEKAVNLLEEIPHLWAKNFLLCDKRGKIAIVEISEQEVIVSYPKSGLGVITNHFQSKVMKRYYDKQSEMYNTHKRLNNAELWFKDKKRTIGEKEVRKFLSDTEIGVCSNKMATDPKKSFVTIWSWFTEVGEKSIRYNTGNPVSGDFQSENF